jgi:hypothetical protein
MSSVALVTCRDLPAGDEDAASLTAALDKLSVAAEWLIWDDTEMTWSHDLVVVRSTWDYTNDRDAFLAWTRKVDRIANPAAVIEWNSDKTYLRDLADVGVPVVATTWAAPGEPLDVPDVAEFVVKPSVGAGSKGAGRFAAADLAAAREHAVALHRAGRTVMVQPYLGGVDDHGETALIYLDGSFSHAVTKGAMLPRGAVNPLDPGFSHSLYVEERIVAARASAAELSIGDLVMAEVERRDGRSPLYARVDLLPSADGPVLVELELTEPSLFLDHADGAAERFAGAIAGRL